MEDEWYDKNDRFGIYKQESGALYLTVGEEWKWVLEIAECTKTIVKMCYC